MSRQIEIRQARNKFKTSKMFFFLPRNRRRSKNVVRLKADLRVSIEWVNLS
jgi:hypothetical protein